MEADIPSDLEVYVGAVLEPFLDEAPDTLTRTLRELGLALDERDPPAPTLNANRRGGGIRYRYAPRDSRKVREKWYNNGNIVRHLLAPHSRQASVDRLGRLAEHFVSRGQLVYDEADFLDDTAASDLVYRRWRSNVRSIVEIVNEAWRTRRWAAPASVSRASLIKDSSWSLLKRVAAGGASISSKAKLDFNGLVVNFLDELSHRIGDRNDPLGVLQALNETIAPGRAGIASWAAAAARASFIHRSAGPSCLEMNDVRKEGHVLRCTLSSAGTRRQNMQDCCVSVWDGGEEDGAGGAGCVGFLRALNRGQYEFRFIGNVPVRFLEDDGNTAKNSLRCKKIQAMDVISLGAFTFAAAVLKRASERLTETGAAHGFEATGVRRIMPADIRSAARIVGAYLPETDQYLMKLCTVRKARQNRPGAADDIPSSTIDETCRLAGTNEVGQHGGPVGSNDPVWHNASKDDEEEQPLETSRLETFYTDRDDGLASEPNTCLSHSDEEQCNTDDHCYWNRGRRRGNTPAQSTCKRVPSLQRWSRVEGPMEQPPHVMGDRTAYVWKDMGLVHNSFLNTN